MDLTSFTHSGNLGDILASLPAMNTYFEKTKKQIHLDLIANVPAFYYEGAVHPTKSSETGKAVMLNESMIEMIKPLLLMQQCINSVGIIQNFDVEKDGTILKDHVRLEAIRETYVGMPNLSINRWYFYVYPDLACDLSKPWLEVPDAEKDFAKDKIIITRTERYTNPHIDYSFLKPYEDEIVFSGTMREYNVFCMTYDLNIRKLTITNFLELAQAIKQSRFHITNQTMANQISQGIFHPSILEVCGFAPNCIPIGENRYDFLSQRGLEWAFHQLNGTIKSYIETIKKTVQ